MVQSGTQSPQDLWPAVDDQERMGNSKKKINILIGCLVTGCIVILRNPPVSPGKQPLAKFILKTLGQVVYWAKRKFSTRHTVVIQFKPFSSIIAPIAVI